MKGNPAEGGVAESDLLVVGPGVLGSLVGQYWLQVRTQRRNSHPWDFGFCPNETFLNSYFGSLHV